MMNIDFHKLKPITFVSVILIFLSTVCSGLLFIFMFSHKLFLDLDTFKLLLLSFSITAPFWIVNSFLVSMLSQDDKKIEDDERIQLMSLIGSLFSVPVFSIPILVKVFVDYTVQYGVAGVIISEILLAVICLNSLRNK